MQAPLSDGHIVYLNSNTSLEYNAGNVMLKAVFTDDTEIFYGHGHSAKLKFQNNSVLVESNPVSHETSIAILEAEMAPSAEDYFAARPMYANRREAERLFEAGFKRGYEARRDNGS